MSWFKILKATPVFDDEYPAMGYYDGEAKINLAQFRHLKDRPDEEVIEAILEMDIHEDVHALFNEGKHPEYVVIELLLKPLAKVMVDLRKKGSLSSRELSLQIRIKMRLRMEKFVHLTMIDEVFAYHAGVLHIEEPFHQRTPKTHMTSYIPKYTRNLSEYLDSAFKNHPIGYSAGYNESELDEIKNTLVNMFRGILIEEISKLRGD